MKTNDCILVSVDFSNGKDNDVLIVGRQESGKVKVLNAFQGEEARPLYSKLVGENLPDDLKKKVEELQK